MMMMIYLKMTLRDIKRERDRETEPERDRERQRETERETERDRERQRETETERERERDAHTHMRTPTVYGDRQEPVRETESGLPATGFFCIDNLVL